MGSCCHRCSLASDKLTHLKGGGDHDLALSEVGNRKGCCLQGVGGKSHLGFLLPFSLYTGPSWVQNKSSPGTFSQINVQAGVRAMKT